MNKETEKGGKLKTLEEITTHSDGCDCVENKVKEFAMDRAKEIELVLIYKIKEHTEIIDGKLVWNAEIRAELQERKEVIKNLENEIKKAVQVFENITEIKENYPLSLYQLKNNINDIFRERDIK